MARYHGLSRECEGIVSYRNKTYVAFASEDIHNYRLMQAWKANSSIEFDFFDAHDLNFARDTSQPSTIKRRLRERLANTKQAVLLGSSTARRKGSDGSSFLAYEVEAMIGLDLPVVVANLDGGRVSNPGHIPGPFASVNYYTMSVSFQPAIVKYALDEYAPSYAASTNSGPYHYLPSVYSSLGL